MLITGVQVRPLVLTGTIPTSPQLVCVNCHLEEAAWFWTPRKNILNISVERSMMEMIWRVSGYENVTLKYVAIKITRTTHFCDAPPCEFFFVITQTKMSILMQLISKFTSLLAVNLVNEISRRASDAALSSYACNTITENWGRYSSWRSKFPNT